MGKKCGKVPIITASRDLMGHAGEIASALYYEGMECDIVGTHFRSEAGYGDVIEKAAENFNKERAPSVVIGTSDQASVAARHFDNPVVFSVPGDMDMGTLLTIWIPP